VFVAAAWLAVAATRWAWAGVAEGGGGRGLDAYAALGAAAAVDVVLGWVAVALAATASAALGGRVGRLGDAVAGRVAPATLRRAVEVALGIGLAAGAVVPLTTAPAGARLPVVVAADATGAGPTAPGSSTLGGPAVPGRGPLGELPGVDRPGYRPSTGTGSVRLTGSALAGPPAAASDDPYADLPGIDRPAIHASGDAGPGWVPAVPPPLPPAAPPPPDVRLVTTAPGVVEATLDEVVVRRGDTLWAIAARALGPGADAAEVATAWPRWYAANRGAIGPDPDLIRPGTLLVPPPPA
jgi:hypothetical protein